MFSLVWKKKALKTTFPLKTLERHWSNGEITNSRIEEQHSWMLLVLWLSWIPKIELSLVLPFALGRDSNYLQEAYYRASKPSKFIWNFLYNYHYCSNNLKKVVSMASASISNSIPSLPNPNFEIFDGKDFPGVERWNYF